MSATITMSWLWIGIAFAAPTLLAILVAAPIWWQGDATVANVVGSGVAGLSIVLLILRENSMLVSIRLECATINLPCHIVPNDFTRFAIYAGIGFIDIMLVFLIGLRFEERRR